MNIVTSELEPGFEIHWYQIKSVLGRGGFGITYLAWDKNLDKKVAIKEYLPHDFAKRGEDSTVQPISQEFSQGYSYGLDRFMKEAKTLAKFKHPNISHVSSYFELNNTGYMVMDYEDGRPLNEIYETKGTLTQRELEDIYLLVLDGLSLVHEAGFIHRDIKPSNIYIRHDNSPVLIDFGAARQTTGARNMTLTSMLTEGYAPSEQYNQNSDEQGPWTDIYAIGACLYQGITGEKPVSSIERTHYIHNKNIDPLQPLSRMNINGYSFAFLRAIDEALMVRFGDRPASLQTFIGMLKGKIPLTELPDLSSIEHHTGNDGVTVLRPPISKEYASSTNVESEDPTRTRVRSDTAPTGTTNGSTTGSYALNQSTASKRGLLPLGAGIAALLIMSVIAWVFFNQSQVPESLMQEATKDEQQQLQKLQVELELKEALLAKAETERKVEEERIKREQAERELAEAKMAQKAREDQEAERLLERKKQAELAKQAAEKKKQAELAKQAAEKKKTNDSLATVEQPISKIGVSGTYRSDIIGSGSWSLGRSPNIEVILKQNNGKISGTFSGTRSGEIEGILDGDTIKFKWFVTAGRTESGKGEWKLSNDGINWTGTWRSNRGSHGNWNLTKITTKKTSQTSVIQKTNDSLATVEQPISKIGVSGTYRSDITSNSDYFKKEEDRAMLISFVQTGNRIIGTTSSTKFKIIGTRDGDNITFYVPTPNKFSQWQQIAGTWKVSADGTRLEGTWSVNQRGYYGEWNLRRLPTP